MKLATYLFFDGQCEAAFADYQRILGGRIEAMLRYEGSPGDVTPGWGGKIMHACLELDGGQMLMASDAPPERSGGPMQSVYASVTVQEPAEAERIYAALSEGGKVMMPMAETFWAPRFGMLADRYGALWMISCAPAATA